MELGSVFWGWALSLENAAVMIIRLISSRAEKMHGGQFLVIIVTLLVQGWLLCCFSIIGGVRGIFRKNDGQ